MPQINELDQRVLGAMNGAERVRMLLRDAGFKTLTAFAHEIRAHTQVVSYCINGEREYPEVRVALARHLGLSREDVDAMIDGPAEVAVPAAGAA